MYANGAYCVRMGVWLSRLHGILQQLNLPTRSSERKFVAERQFRLHCGCRGEIAQRQPDVPAEVAPESEGFATIRLGNRIVQVEDVDLITASDAWRSTPRATSTDLICVAAFTPLHVTENDR